MSVTKHYLMRRNIWGIVAVAFLLVVLPVLSGAGPAKAEAVDRVVAVVGGEVITLRELEEVAEQMPDAPREKVLEMMIEDMLIGQEAKKQGITITDADVETSIQSRMAQLNLSDEEFKKMLQEQGLTVEQLKEKIRTKLIKFKFVEHQVRGGIDISDEEVLNYYRLHPADFKASEQVHLAHIFLPFPLANDAAEQEKVRKLATEIQQRIVKGEDFTEMAKKYSKMTSMNAEGKEEVTWDLGWIKNDDLNPTLRKATEGLPAGAISQPFESDKGMHILKVLERKGAETLPLEQVKPAIYDQLYEIKVQEALYKIIQEIKERTPIERKL